MTRSRHKRQTNRLQPPLIALAAVIAMLAAACGGTSGPASASPQPFKLVAAGVLTVATFGDSPPIVVLGSGDQISGLNGVVLNEFAATHHLTVKLFKTTFPSAILAVQQSKADVG